MEYDTYNMPRVEHYERVERDRELAPMADEKEGSLQTLKKLLKEAGIMRTTPIQNWPMFHIYDHEKDLIDLHEAEAKEQDDNFNN